MAMVFRYPSLISLDGSALTDESRQPLQEDREERSVTMELASGRKRKFIKGILRKWDITWENVGESAEETVDGFGGRNEIRALAMSGDTMTLIIRDRDTVESYTVFVDGYSEELILRRTTNRYNITLSLEEQG